MGGDHISLLYIIDHKVYDNYLSKGIYKYVPKIFLPRFIPKIIESIKIDEDKTLHIVGVNTKSIDYSQPLLLEEYINSILKLHLENCRTIVIEGIGSMDDDVGDLIYNKTNLKIPKGEGIRLFNIPIIIRHVLKAFNRDMNQEEVLIITENKGWALELIGGLSKDFKFISLVGMDDLGKDEIYNEILDSIGLSIFQPLNINEILKNYGVVINLSELEFLKPGSIRKNAIIIDFSRSKSIKSSMKSSSNMIIEDIVFNMKSLNIGEIPWIDDEISPQLYEGFFGQRLESFDQIFINNKCCNIGDYVNDEIRIKGGL